MTLPRNLKFDDRFVYHLNRQIDGDCEGEPIEFPDLNTKIKFAVEMSGLEFRQILSALMTGADLSYPENNHEIVWILLRQVECPVSICDEILACLQPAFDELNAKIDECATVVESIQETAEQIQEAQENNQSVNPPGVESGIDPQLCGAAAAVVDWMNLTNEQIYADAESGIFDTLMEAFASVLLIIPKLAGLPAATLASLTQGYFENQAADYQTDFALARTTMIQRLYCALLQNDGEFTYDIWADWLNALDAALPGNRAASIFARYSPLRQTFINQIAQFFNQDISLQDFFNQLYAAFETGKGSPIGLCVSAACTGTCALRYSYFEQHDWAPLPGNTPTLDSAGWYIAGPFTGFSNPRWVIGEDMTATGSYTAFRVDTLDLTKNPVEYNTQIWYYDSLGVQVVFDVFSPEMTVIEEGNAVTFLVDIVTPVAITGWGFNVNDDTDIAFRATGAQLCE